MPSAAGGRAHGIALRATLALSSGACSAPRGPAAMLEIPGFSAAPARSDEDVAEKANGQGTESESRTSEGAEVATTVQTGPHRVIVVSIRPA